MDVVQRQYVRPLDAIAREGVRYCRGRQTFRKFIAYAVRNDDDLFGGNVQKTHDLTAGELRCRDDAVGPLDCPSRGEGPGERDVPRQPPGIREPENVCEQEDR